MRKSAQQHGAYEDVDLDRSAEEVCESRAWAQADESPADTEEYRPSHELRVEIPARRDGEALREPGPRSPTREREARGTQEQSCAHHASEGWIPDAEYVEEAQHLGGIRHPGDREARAEHDPADPRDSDSHHLTPNPCRTRTTVSAAVVMKSTVATMERREPRAMPQTP